MMRNYDAALPLYERALRIQQELVGPNHGDVALTLNDMAVLQYRRRDFAAAEELYLRAIKTYESVFGQQHPTTAQAILNIAQFFKGIGNPEKAKKYFKMALDIFVAHHGESHQKCQSVSFELQQLA